MPRKPLLGKLKTQWLCALSTLILVLIVNPLAAQQERRSLRVWVDTIDLNVCGDKEFETWAVWLESFTDADTAIGFRKQDSVLGCTMVLFWDTSKIRLKPPYVLTPSQTVFSSFPNKRAIPDTNTGALWLDYSADDKLRTVIRTDVPLFYLTGRVQAEDTVAPLNGGAKVNSIDIAGVLGENIGTLDFPPGFVRVIRDTTPEYTGTLRTTEADLDTNRQDTVSVIVGNLFDKRVNEFQLALKADISKYKFVDTVTAGTLASKAWNTREIHISEDSLFVRVHDDNLLSTEDSLVIRIVIERQTDSAFTANIEIPVFGINFASCIGKLTTSGSVITGKKIPIKDTITALPNNAEEGSTGSLRVVQADNELRLYTGIENFVEITLYNLRGSEVARWPGAGRTGSLRLPLPIIAPGRYFLVLTEEDGKKVYKQLHIQTK